MRTPYQALLGAAFDTLHPSVRQAHEAPLNAEGEFDVVHGTHRVTRLLVALMKLPAFWSFALKYGTGKGVARHERA